MRSRTETFPVHGYEVDAFGTLAPAALSGFLQEVAGLHAAELGVGLDALRAKGLTWVLSRQRVELPAPIRLGDRLEIETWPSGLDRVAAVREFLVRRGAEEVARATTQWLVVHVATRRPVRPAEVLDPRFPREARTPAVALTPGRLPELRGWELEARFRVRYADIDGNLHATNASYVTWATEVVPPEVWRSSRLAAVEVHYLAEALHGATVVSRAARAGEESFAHAIVREDGKELARAVTQWARR